jgi:hypothetical protein
MRMASKLFIAAAEAVLPPITAVVDSIRNVVEEVDPDEVEFDIDRIIIAFAECFREAIAVEIAAGAGGHTAAIAKMFFKLLEFIDGLLEYTETLLAKTIVILAFLIDAAPDQMRESLDDKPGFELVLKLAANADVEPELIEQVMAFAGIEPE